MQKMTWNSDCLKLFLCRIPMAKEDSGKTARSRFATECNKYATDICWTTLWQAKQNWMALPSVNVSSNSQSSVSSKYRIQSVRFLSLMMKNITISYNCLDCNSYCKWDHFCPSDMLSLAKLTTEIHQRHQMTNGCLQCLEYKQNTQLILNIL